MKYSGFLYVVCCKKFFSSEITKYEKKKKENDKNSRVEKFSLDNKKKNKWLYV